MDPTRCLAAAARDKLSSIDVRSLTIKTQHMTLPAQMTATHYSVKNPQVPPTLGHPHLKDVANIQQSSIKPTRMAVLPKPCCLGRTSLEEGASLSLKTDPNAPSLRS